MMVVCQIPKVSGRQCNHAQQTEYAPALVSLQYLAPSAKSLDGSQKRYKIELPTDAHQALGLDIQALSQILEGIFVEESCLGSHTCTV